MVERQVLCEGCELQNSACHMLLPEEEAVDILFLGSHPTEEDASNQQPFSDSVSIQLRHFLYEAVKKNSNRKNISYAFSYACLCPSNNEKDTISTSTITRCSQHIRGWMKRNPPKAVVALGTDALKALGVTEKLQRGTASMHGSFFLVQTYDISSLLKHPGRASSIFIDICKAFSFLETGEVPHPIKIATPCTAEEIIQALNQAQEYTASHFAKTGQRTLVAVDTETSSLDPYKQQDRILSISLSWQNDQGLAFPFQHKDCPFSEKNSVYIKEALKSFLCDPSVAVAMANGKFDFQWLNLHYKMGLPYQKWDVILAEHVLDEDKSEDYSLKVQTRDRFPELGRYEQELKEILEEIKKKKAEKVKELETSFEDRLKAFVTSWWANLSVEARKQYTHDASLLNPKKTPYIKQVCSRLVKMVKALPQGTIPNLPTLNIPATLTTVSYEDIPLETLLQYGAMDALTTRLIALEQVKDFKLLDQEYKSVMQQHAYTLPSIGFLKNTMPLAQALGEMEFFGVKVNREKIEEYIGILDGKSKKLEEVLCSLLEKKVNWSSSPQIIKLLYTDYSLPVLKYTRTGQPSTDASVLKELARLYPQYSFLQKLLELRGVEKCRDTYLKKWLDFSSYDGRIHTNFNQALTATQRLSSSNPNLQNISEFLALEDEERLNLKGLFLPDEGYAIYNLDIVNAELRVLTAYSQDAALIDAFNANRDLHSETAASFSDKYTYEEIRAKKDDKTSEQYKLRQVGKRVAFGISYCMGPRTLKQNLYNTTGIDLSEEECREYMDTFFRKFPGVKRYIDTTKQAMSSQNSVYTFTGRRRHYFMPIAMKGVMAQMERKAVNARIQTTSSDLVMMNLLDLRDWLAPLGGKILLTVHDSIVFELPEGMQSKVKSDLEELITGKTAIRAPWLPVKWKFDCEYGPTYGDAHNKL